MKTRKQGEQTSSCQWGEVKEGGHDGGIGLRG